MALLIARDWHGFEILEKRLEKTSPKNHAEKLMLSLVFPLGGIGQRQRGSALCVQNRL